MQSNNRYLFFVSNNIGGLVSLIPLIDYYEKNKIKCVIIYNAKYKIFLKNLISRKIPIIKKIKLNRIIDLLTKFNPRVVITSTTYPKDLIVGDIENQFIYHSIKFKIKTIAVLDHWCGYKERFYSNINGKNQLIIPNLICVMDLKAKKEILNKINLNENIIKITGNPSWDKIKNIKPTLDNTIIQNTNYDKKKKTILFISEVISEEKKRMNYSFDEFQVLDNILKVFKNNHNILIKKHPRESKKKYLKIIEENKDTNIVLLDDLFNPFNSTHIYDGIIGMTSILLVEFALFGLNVLSIQPSKNNIPIIDFGFNIKLIFSYKKLEKLEFKLNKTNKIYKKYHFKALDNIINIVN